MKKIEFFPSIYPLHGAYRSLLTSPPEGYSFSQPNINFGVFSRLKSYKIIKTIYKKITQLLRINFSQKIIDLQKSQKNSDLIFSTGVLYKGNSPWVLDLLDVPQSLTGYNYNLFVNSTKKITHFLLRDNCKAIICANKTCWDIMENNFSKRVIDKMVLIHPGLNLPKDTFDKKSKNPKDIQFLFMGSLTNPDDFLIKGGLESLEVFKGYP
ncbi:hypothetical protein HN865_02225 [Candidatus Woesearchaeota archaeon]|nr:hypothetical protein [Candidatus Woesearchaeota archaeon]